jgi:hypothetical protein
MDLEKEGRIENHYSEKLKDRGGKVMKDLKE